MQHEPDAHLCEARSDTLDEATAWMEHKGFLESPVTTRQHPEGARRRTVAVFGATGGIGSAVVEALDKQGAITIAVGRDPLKLGRIRETTGATTIAFDLMSRRSLDGLVEKLPVLDAAIIVSGVDVRKSLVAHSNAEIQATLDVNLHGPIILTRALLARMRRGSVIAHIGGFGDGRLALPFYSVDVASRAATAAFCEALSRELRIQGRDIVVSYLCPEPTDTAAERPFRALWRRLGTRMVTTEATATFILQAVRARRPLAIMGWATRLITRINTISPLLADILYLNKSGKALREAFGDQRGAGTHRRG